MRACYFLLSFFLSGPIASAAAFRSSISSEGKVILYLEGEIVAGDAAQLTAQIKAANDGGKLVSGIRLNSPGGNVAEGDALSRVVANAKIATVVPNGKICASACFLVFAAGYEKYVSFAAQVGVHGASDANGNETTGSAAATVLMARRAKELGVPPPILGKMVTTPPSQMIWLAPDELRAMGTTMTGKPSQTQGLPTPQAQTQTLPSAPPADPNAVWKEIVDKALAASAEQNGGRPNFGRACQAELKICNMAVFFKSKTGEDMMVRAASDINDKVVKRDVCSFNSYGDIRTCFDWDTGAKTQEMKDSSGNWRPVN